MTLVKNVSQRVKYVCALFLSPCSKNTGQQSHFNVESFFFTIIYLKYSHTLTIRLLM